MLMIGFLGIFAALANLSLQPITPQQLQELLKNSPKPLVVNVWATWCIPCVEELPEIVQWGEENRQQATLVLVSADFSSRRELVLRFLQERRLLWPSYIKEGSDEALIAVLHPQWSGALPATFVYAPGGELVAFFERKVAKADLDQALAEVARKRKGGKR